LLAVIYLQQPQTVPTPIDPVTWILGALLLLGFVAGCVIRNLPAKRPVAVPDLPDPAVSRFMAKQEELRPRQSCRRCGESDWELEKMAESGQVARWRCEFCGCRELVREGQDSRTETNGCPPIPKSVMREVWQRDNGQCVECGRRENLEFDHIIPFSRGGSSTARNLQLLCEACNRTKASKIG
jgi:hypothetical protein